MTQPTPIPCVTCKAKMTFRKLAANRVDELWSCPNCGKVQVYVNSVGIPAQRRNGRGPGVSNKAPNVSIRPGARFLVRLKEAGYTVQDWWNYTESLDIPARG